VRDAGVRRAAGVAESATLTPYPYPYPYPGLCAVRRPPVGPPGRAGAPHPAGASPRHPAGTNRSGVPGTAWAAAGRSAARTTAITG
jgi:hypothetical protein